MSVRLPTASIPKGTKVDMSTISNMGTKNPDSAEEQKEKTKKQAEAVGDAPVNKKNADKKKGTSLPKPGDEADLKRYLKEKNKIPSQEQLNKEFDRYVGRN